MMDTNELQNDNSLLVVFADGFQELYSKTFRFTFVTEPISHFIGGFKQAAMLVPDGRFFFFL